MITSFSTNNMHFIFGAKIQIKDKFRNHFTFLGPKIWEIFWQENFAQNFKILDFNIKRIFLKKWVIIFWAPSFATSQLVCIVLIQLWCCWVDFLLSRLALSSAHKTRDPCQSRDGENEKEEEEVVPLPRSLLLLSYYRAPLICCLWPNRLQPH